MWTPEKGGGTYDGPEQQQSRRVGLISGRLGWIGRHEWIRQLGKRRLAVGERLATRQRFEVRKWLSVRKRTERQQESGQLRKQRIRRREPWQHGWIERIARWNERRLRLRRRESRGSREFTRVGEHRQQRRQLEPRQEGLRRFRLGWYVGQRRLGIGEIRWIERRRRQFRQRRIQIVQRGSTKKKGASRDAPFFFH